MNFDAPVLAAAAAALALVAGPALAQTAADDAGHSAELRLPKASNDYVKRR